MCVNVVVRQVAGGDMRRMPEGEETIFPRTTLLPQKVGIPHFPHI